ncbi:hypothetical protein M8494_12700 [Serratia ureilytica]
MYLHGTPCLRAEPADARAFLMWMSADYQRNFGIDRQCLNALAEKDDVSQDNLFHTLLGMLNVQTREYQSRLDILQPCRNAA